MTAVSRLILRAAFLLGTLAGCAGTQTTAGAGVPDASTPGWTGRTVVVGSNSTVGGVAAATEMQQKWQLGPSR
jgi:hypothetical protein